MVNAAQYQGYQRMKSSPDPRVLKRRETSESEQFILSIKKLKDLKCVQSVFESWNKNVLNANRK